MHSKIATLCLFALTLNSACTKSEKPGTPTPSRLPLGPTVENPAQNPLTNSGPQSCALYEEERCVDSTAQTCTVYDTDAQSFPETIDPLFEQTLLFDRWYDLYGSPAGLAAERVFNRSVAPNETEEDWGTRASFASYVGVGDATIWTGAAATASAFRYATTGTDADYERMEQITRNLLRNFEVTGVKGYVARNHFLLVPPGTPNTDAFIMRAENADMPGQRDNPIINPNAISGLPEAYKNGVPDGKGGTVIGKPMWNGHPSIDQYTGPMMAFPIVYDLLRDEPLKKSIAEQLTCYLKRLGRIEIINLDQNPKLQQDVATFFVGAGLNLDDRDIDVKELNRIVVYYNRGINKTNFASFDKSCPNSVATVADRVLDAADGDEFIVQLLELGADLESNSDRENQIDHMYAVNIRGADASHLMHLATMAYYFTGDEQYLDFLFDELIGNLNAVEVANSMRMFSMPKWCDNFYGDHITYTTHWQFVSMLRDSPLKTDMQIAMRDELWRKALKNFNNAHFNILYASVVPETLEPERATLIEQAITTLGDIGGQGYAGGIYNAPRRNYALSRSFVVDNLPEGITVHCPTEEERAVCEINGTFFGVPIPAKSISRACNGSAGECTFDDGQCTNGVASEGLPPSLRQYADFLWQRDPFSFGDGGGQVRQSPGIDLSEPFWIARYFGFTTAGTNQVLAWRDSGSCL